MMHFRFILALTVAVLASILSAEPGKAPRAVLPSWAPSEASLLPAIPDLPVSSIPPDPLVMRDGTRVTDAAAWRARRRELLLLFQHYMYGYIPPLPADVEVRTTDVDPDYLSGAATRKILELRFGPGKAGKTTMYVVTPNGKAGRVPCIFGPDYDWNEAQLAAASVRRGYAFATFLKEQLAPDARDGSSGVYHLYFKPGQVRRGPHEWGALGVWAWGFGIAAKQLASDPRIDPARLVAVGHSRKGKAALLAGALYESISIIVAHQSGTGGAAPLRVPEHKRIQTVSDLVDEYPYWFAGVFASFYDQPEKLPFSAACLVALCAPRPVLLGVATDEHWTNPEGQLHVLELADPVYRLLGVEGLRDRTWPREPGSLSASRLGLYVRSQKGHDLTPDDWERFMDYADTMFGEASRGKK